MAIFASTTLGSSDPSKAMSIKALEARAQALAAAQAKQEAPTSLPSPWQGAGLVMNQAADAFATKRADQAAAQRRQDLASIMSAGGTRRPEPAAVGADHRCAIRNIGKTYMQEIAAAAVAGGSDPGPEGGGRRGGQGRRGGGGRRRKGGCGRGRRRTGAQIEESVRAGQQTPEQAAEERGKAFGPNPAEIKARSDQENTHIEAQSFVNSLAEAQDLVNTGVYNGKGAAYQGEYGKGLTGYATDFIGATDPKTTQRDDRYNKIMNTVATQMTAAMKGSQSDKELTLALDTARNPNATKEAKQQALDVIIKKAQLHAQVSEEGVKSLKGSPKYLEPYKPGSSLALGNAPAAGGAAGSGSDSGTNWSHVAGRHLSVAGQRQSCRRQWEMDDRTG